MMKFIILLVLFISSGLFADSITLRGEGGQTYQGVISSGSYDGIRFTIDGSGEGATLFPWSKVATFTSTRPRPALEKFHEDGSRLWRARIRLQRGDLLLAEPIFEQICQENTLRESYDARVAYEGYLRCLIARGKIKEAVPAWLMTASLEELGIPTPYPNLSPVVDVDTLLCPHLPLIWLTDQSAKKMLAVFDQPSSPRLQELVNKLRNAISDDDARTQQNISQLIASIHTQLENSDQKPWLAMWANWFSALSELSKSSTSNKNDALLKLAIVASEGRTSQPWLACAAMYRLADELRKNGNIESASQIIDDAKRSFPSHPIHHSDDFKIRNELQ